MTLIFTNTDKGLLQRAARNLDEIGKGLLKTHGPVWSATKEGVKAKLVFDRLQRDSRDLRAMAKRIIGVNKLLMEAPVISLPAEHIVGNPPISIGEAPDTGNCETPPWPFPSELKTEVEVVPGAEIGSLAAQAAAEITAGASRSLSSTLVSTAGIVDRG